MRQILLIIFLFGILTLLTNREKAADKKRRMDLSEYSYATGCLVESLNVCSKTKDVIVRGKCYEEGFEKCPKMAKGFRDWLEAGPGKTNGTLPR